MCFCRRKNNSKEDVDSNRPVEHSKRANREPPLPSVVQPKVSAPLGQPQPPREEKKPQSAPRSHVTRRRQRHHHHRRGEDDTITNIPDEMPDMEINREHGEPFYTDEQLM